MTTRPIPLLLVLILFTPYATTIAQTAVPLHMQQNEVGKFTIIFEGGYASGVSASMRGTNAEFQSDLEKDYNNSTYPFGDPNAWGAGFGLRVERRLLPGNFSVYLDCRIIGFTTSDAANDSVALNILSTGLGEKYTYNISRSLDLYGSAGINESAIWGHVEGLFGDIPLAAQNLRFGFELGLGGEWNPFSIILLRLFVDYSDVNVIGKSYTAPGATPPEFLFSRGLNDGANPNNPNDSPRTIDYLLSGIALGVRF